MDLCATSVSLWLIAFAKIICGFKLDVGKQNRATCFHDLAGSNATEDAINKTHSVNNCAGILAIHI